VSESNTDDLLREIGRRVASIRRERGWTQDRLATELAVSVKYVQRIEGGRENLTVRSLVKLADALGGQLQLDIETNVTAGSVQP